MRLGGRHIQTNILHSEINTQLKLGTHNSANPSYKFTETQQTTAAELDSVDSHYCSTFRKDYQILAPPKHSDPQTYNYKVL